MRAPPRLSEVSPTLKNKNKVRLTASTFFQATELALPQKISELCFSLFNCCLSVVLQLEKGDYPENSHVVFCPNKQRYSEPFIYVWIFPQWCLTSTETLWLIGDGQ